MTLYEIVLSIAIFTLAMAAISQLITLGTRASIQAQLRTEAAMRAENKMSEIVAGAYPLTSVGGEADPQDASWLWGLEVADVSEVSGTKALTVTVTHLAQSGEPDTVFTLKRLMLDPQLYIDAALEEEEGAEAQSGTTGSSGSGGTTTSSGAGTSGAGTSGTSSGGGTSPTQPGKGSGGTPGTGSGGASGGTGNKRPTGGTP